MLLQPALGLLVLALWAMPIATGVILIDVVVAVRAVINLSAERCRPTVLNRPHRLPMAGQQALAKLGSIGWAVLLKNLGQFDHATSAITRLMAANARSSVGEVRCV